jgi:hypothetical protein
MAANAGSQCLTSRANVHSISIQARERSLCGRTNKHESRFVHQGIAPVGTRHPSLYGARLCQTPYDRRWAKLGGARVPVLHPKYCTSTDRHGTTTQRRLIRFRFRSFFVRAMACAAGRWSLRMWYSRLLTAQVRVWLATWGVRWLRSATHRSLVVP